MTQAPPDQTGIDATVSALLAQVGQQVRAVREGRAMTRRALSEVSGVSPRYLAQLEAGQGNISIGLLQRVALALEAPVARFLTASTADPAGDAEAARVAALFQRADPVVRARVLSTLTAGRPGRAGRICLIGLRGAGKSSLGAAAGRALDLPFAELNRAVEEAAGMPTPEILAMYGQDWFRQLEAEALETVIAGGERMILAVGGGIVTEAANFDRLLARFHTIWLRAAPEEHMDRVRAQGDTRPMAGNPEAMTQLKSILAARAPLYDRAEAVLDTTGRSFDQSLGDLVALIGERGFADGSGHPDG